MCSSLHLCCLHLVFLTVQPVCICVIHFLSCVFMCFLVSVLVHGFMVSVCHAVLICDVCLSLGLFVQLLVCMSVCACHWLCMCVYLCVWVQYVCPHHVSLYTFHITPLLQWTEAGHPFSSWSTIIGLDCDGNRQLSL